MASVTIGKSKAAVPPAAKDAALSAVGVSSATKPLLTFCVLFILSWVGVDLSRHSGGVSTIWLSNGLLFAIVIRKPRNSWLPFAGAGLAADILADRLFGDTLRVAFGVSCANSLEVFGSAFLLTHWFGSPFRLSRSKPLFGFLAVAVVAMPAVTGVLSSTWLSLFDTLDWWQTTRTWYLGDALGMAIIAPLVFTVQEPDFFAILRRRELPKTLLVLTVPILGTVLDFAQSKEVLVAFLFPTLFFVVFWLGFRGAVLGIVVIAVIAIAFTVAGHGPFSLIPGMTVLHRIVLVQALLAVALLTTFPVAAVLEERKALELSLQLSEAKYRELANTDALTGQANRRAFDERLNTEWSRAAETGLPLSLLSIDIDFFKSYNDLYGHIAGDDCLRRIAALAAGPLPQPSSARLYRLGGEEFAVIAPNTEAVEALSLGETIRQAVSGSRIEHTGSPLGYATISVGIATTVPSMDRSALSLVALSDQALYTAKHNGRDRCVGAG